MIYKKIEIKVDGYKETADLYTYFLDNSIEMNINRKRPVVVICPGGGYAMTSDREASVKASKVISRSPEVCIWKLRSHSWASRLVAKPRLHFCLRSPVQS